ncbi:hypothetical protein EZ456_05100 [Pedobacter psychrodurus]|uniref:ABM domain-containing protein n=1 Tax=Pedobacter psychrodurus TaxID=2530456 RepID=A0A4R0PZS7_9SPHI|nr:hypothetical protein [Pedobacter psychrodurus]TCD28761.1 hypothetical protein EZ456_05100 [Pedobacter psychrodurus]
MITVKVTYGVKKEFVSKNKENITIFMADFKAMNSRDFKYNVYTLDDETAFVHISEYANEQVQKKVLSTPSFVEFQRQRDASGLIKAHHIEVLHSFAASSDA